MDESRSTTELKTLTPEELQRLQEQNTRLVSDFKALQLEKDAKKHWDLFYKRNETRFFKDRHWTTREFCDLLNFESPSETRTLWEVGCGVGNFIFPLIEENLNFKYIVCDLSTKAVSLVKEHELYNEDVIRAFQGDITDDDIIQLIGEETVDVATLIFVLSAIHPDKFITALRNIFKCLKPGGFLLFRDYGLYDMAQLRFKAGHKIGENFYMRQDGTRSYYYSIEFVNKIMEEAGFKVASCGYIHRRTVNKKENLDVPRIFVQGKFLKDCDWRIWKYQGQLGVIYRERCCLMKEYRGLRIPILERFAASDT